MRFEARGDRTGSSWRRSRRRRRPAHAVTRDLADVPTFTLTFGRSVLNQLTYDTYRTPFDELQTRPYNLLFANIARQPNFGAWPGQQGSYARYVDALIGNNGAANVGQRRRRDRGDDDPARDRDAGLGDLDRAFLAGTLEERRHRRRPRRSRTTTT